MGYKPRRASRVTPLTTGTLNNEAGWRTKEGSTGMEPLRVGTPKSWPIGYDIMWGYIIRWGTNILVIIVRGYGFVWNEGKLRTSEVLHIITFPSQLAMYPVLRQTRIPWRTIQVKNARHLSIKLVGGAKLLGCASGNATCSRLEKMYFPACGI